MEEIQRPGKGDDRSSNDIKTHMEGATQAFVDQKLANLEKRPKVNEMQTRVCILPGALAFPCKDISST